jgi:hypothetical protein
MADGTLNLDSSSVAYGDSPLTSAPLQKYFDWQKSQRGIPVGNPQSTPYSVVPGSSLTVFNGTRTLTADGTTVFALTLDPQDTTGTTYFLTQTAGTAPGFRTDRGLTLSGSTLSVTPQANNSVLFTITAGGTFSGVLAGDSIFIPGLSTGDPAGPFNTINEGPWVVLAVQDSTDLILVRPSGSTLAFVGQTNVILSANSQFQAFSAAGVQVGDSVDISAGVTSPSPLLSTFPVIGVTANRMVILSTNPLPLLTGITFVVSPPSLVVYSNGKRWLRIEADQACAVQVNGDTGATQRLTPWSPADPQQVAIYEKVGPAWSLTVANRSTATLNLLVFSAE